MLIYKIFRAAEWAAFQTDSVTNGAPIDVSDGYIHFSTAGQVSETAAKHFSGVADLVIVAVDVESLGESLTWETSRGGALFPHLYRQLHMQDVVWSKPMPLGPSGHILPEGVE